MSLQEKKQKNMFNLKNVSQNMKIKSKYMYILKLQKFGSFFSILLPFNMLQLNLVIIFFIQNAFLTLTNHLPMILIDFLRSPK